MTDVPPAIGAGDVTITLGDKELTLRPTFEACDTLSKSPGLQFWREQIFSEIRDGYTKVISAGLGMAGPSKDMLKLIYETGFISLKQPLILFLGNISNGGRPIGERVQCNHCGSWYFVETFDEGGRESSNPPTESS